MGQDKLVVPGFRDSATFCELALHGVSSYTGATVHGVRMHGGEFWVHALGEGTSV
jgi:hypothetical protein